MAAGKTGYDILGNLALMKFKPGEKAGRKRKAAERILKKNKAVKTVLEKTGKFKGRLRKQETKWVAGEKTKEALYRENGCVFRFNIDKVYFSSRLSNERKEIAQKVKQGDQVLVMFAGAAPFSIAIARNSGAAKVYSNEMNKEANKYGKMNIQLNNVKNRVVMLDGDIKNIAKKIADGLLIKNVKAPKKFDVIVMPRPQLKDSFLREAFMLSKKGTRIFYYDFCKEDEIHGIVDKVKSSARKYHKKIKILKTKKAGDIAPYRYRVRVDIKVL